MELPALTRKSAATVIAERQLSTVERDYTSDPRGLPPASSLTERVVPEDVVTEAREEDARGFEHPQGGIIPPPEWRGVYPEMIRIWMARGMRRGGEVWRYRLASGSTGLALVRSGTVLDYWPDSIDQIMQPAVDDGSGIG